MIKNKNIRHRFKSIGSSILVCQLNIEGISRAKSDYLSRLLTEETHTPTNEALSTRGYIHGFQILEAINHTKHGIATYIKSEIQDADVIHSCDLL